MNRSSITVLCVDTNSHYHKFPGLDLWTKERDAYNYKGTNPVITHAPCQQWSKLRTLAHNNPYEKELAYFCWQKVQENGGIFEHPAGSSFFKEVNADWTKIYSVNLHWFGFPAQKRTYLYFNKFKPAQMPLNFDPIKTTIERMARYDRSTTPYKMIEWLIKSINECAYIPN